METLDMIAGVAALAMGFGVIAAQVWLTYNLAQQKRQVSQADSDKREALSRLKMAQSQKAVVEQNKSALERKKSKLAKEISHLKRELAEARK